MAMSGQQDVVTIAKVAETDTEIVGVFLAPRARLFEALTAPDQLRHWMRAGPMSLAGVEVDGRAGGGFRYVFQRGNGPRIEVRGAYVTFDPPGGFSYVETYDFSPLRIDVSTGLEEVDGGTAFAQRLHYASARERDEDFDGVASSSREAYARLASILSSPPL
jgi:uncharacterized protein YndB with AHSA1/START domain